MPDSNGAIDPHEVIWQAAQGKQGRVVKALRPLHCGKVRAGTTGQVVIVKRTETHYSALGAGDYTDFAEPTLLVHWDIPHPTEDPVIDEFSLDAYRLLLQEV